MHRAHETGWLLDKTTRSRAFTVCKTEKHSRVWVNHHQHEFVIVLKNRTFHAPLWGEFCIKTSVWSPTKFSNEVKTALSKISLFTKTLYSQMTLISTSKTMSISKTIKRVLVLFAVWFNSKAPLPTQSKKQKQSFAHVKSTFWVILSRLHRFRQYPSPTPLRTANRRLG